MWPSTQERRAELDEEETQMGANYQHYSLAFSKSVSERKNRYCPPVNRQYGADSFILIIFAGVLVMLIMLPLSLGPMHVCAKLQTYKICMKYKW